MWQIHDLKFRIFKKIEQKNETEIDLHSQRHPKINSLPFFFI